MPTVEQLAALLCQIKDLRRAEYATCNPDGTVSVPAAINCGTKRNFALTLQDYLTLYQITSCCDGGDGGGTGGPTTNALTAVGTVLTSTVNGVSAILDLESMIQDVVAGAVFDGVTDVAYDAPTGTWSITYSDATVQTFTPVDKHVTSHNLDPVSNVLTLVLTDGSEVDIDLTPVLVITTLVDNGDGTFTYTNEAGVETTFDTFDPASLTTADIQELSQAVIDAGGSIITDAFGVPEGVLFPAP
jgi:hypothetical protein